MLVFLETSEKAFTFYNTIMNKCPNCGGIFPLNSFVCDYCGYVESEKIKQISSTELKGILIF